MNQKKHKEPCFIVYLDTWKGRDAKRYAPISLRMTRKARWLSLSCVLKILEGCENGFVRQSLVDISGAYCFPIRFLWTRESRIAKS
jgi:hypothetical protein